MKLYAVAGKPILHSLSPQIHEALSVRGKKEAYCRISSDNPRQVISLLREGVFQGLNITSPLKEAMLPFLDRLDLQARSVGAVNTLNQNGRWIEGANTDPEGVLAALDSAGIDPSGQPVLVLGAGGAGRAATYALVKAGARVTVVNRTPAKARACARDFRCRHTSWKNLRNALVQNRGIVSTLSAPSLPFPAAWLPDEGWVLDADYRKRAMFEASRKRGLTAIDGKKWLLAQAIASHSLFHGRKALPTIANPFFKFPSLRKKRVNGISLVGFMGSGKSTIAPMLARALGWNCIDTDRWIEEREGMKIGEIFRLKGEAAFRRLERAALRETAGRMNTILSCGGGAVMNDENRKRLRRHGLVVWLYLPWHEALARNQGGRPLLETNGEDHIRRLYQTRLASYCACADLLTFNQKKPSEVCSDILEEIDPFILH